MTVMGHFKIFGLPMVGLGLLSLLLGCSSVLQEQNKEPASIPAAPQVSKGSDRLEGRYYDFDDILIPNKLKPDAQNSRIFQSTNLNAGVLVLDSYVEVESLVNFFKEAMPRDNWHARGNFILSPKTILLFEKKNKRALIIVDENKGNTRVEIWMIPTQDGQ